MIYLKEFLENIYILLNAMSFFILIGLLIAGILKQIIPDNFVSKHLGGNSFISVIKATILGIPLPVCSCSVIPLAKSLQKEGASRGAVQSFLISTPITGVDSIMATYSFFGWIFTIYRVITSIIIAVVVGLIENIFNKEVKKPKFRLNNIPKNQTIQGISFIQNSSCSSECCSTSNKSDSFSIKNVFDYAFNVLFKDIAKSLLIGVIIGALFTTFLPKEILSTIYNNRLLTYILVIVISMPLYVCATSSLPVAAAFMLSGMSPGGAFIFLSAGPATNSVTMGVIASMFGKRSLIVYTLTIALLSILFGYLLDNYIDSIDVLEFNGMKEGSSVIDIISSIIMVILMLYYTFKKR
jgi:uncharacterized membrane protein YraQ (UPF0718 family)